MSKFVFLKSLRELLTPLKRLIDRKAEDVDWNENDSSASGYIKNRPFYTSDPVFTTIIPKTTVTLQDQGGMFGKMFATPALLEYGNTYVVNWNGTEYTTVCTMAEGAYCIGDASMMTGGTPTGEPFLMAVMPGDGVNMGVVFGLDVTSAQDVTFSVLGEKVEIVKIPEKYLPPQTYVNYDSEQTLTYTQKKIARNNIGAGTGNYNDLINTPNLATVATSGSYDDLINKPLVLSDNVVFARAEEPIKQGEAIYLEDCAPYVAKRTFNKAYSLDLLKVKLTDDNKYLLFLTRNGSNHYLGVAKLSGGNIISIVTTNAVGALTNVKTFDVNPDSTLITIGTTNGLNVYTMSDTTITYVNTITTDNILSKPSICKFVLNGTMLIVSSPNGTAAYTVVGTEFVYAYSILRPELSDLVTDNTYINNGYIFQIDSSGLILFYNYHSYAPSYHLYLYRLFNNKYEFIQEVDFDNDFGYFNGSIYSIKTIPNNGYILVYGSFTGGIKVYKLINNSIKYIQDLPFDFNNNVFPKNVDHYDLLVNNNSNYIAVPYTLENTTKYNIYKISEDAINLENTFENMDVIPNNQNIIFFHAFNNILLCASETKGYLQYNIATYNVSWHNAYLTANHLLSERFNKIGLAINDIEYHNFGAVSSIVNFESNNIENTPNNTNHTTFSLVDQNNGCLYNIGIYNGNLVSYCKASSIEICNMPDKIEYIAGEYFDPTGMIVNVICEDGTRREVSNYKYLDTYLTIDTTSITISYEEFDKIYVTTVPINVMPFDETILIDFEYTIESNGTYTLTEWKNTLNGISSTELIIPNNGLINV